MSSSLAIVRVPLSASFQKLENILSANQIAKLEAIKSGKVQVRIRGTADFDWADEVAGTDFITADEHNLYDLNKLRQTFFRGSGVSIGIVVAQYN